MYYVHSSIDRIGKGRDNDIWVAERLNHPTTRIVPFWQGKPLVAETAEGLLAATVGLGAIDPALMPDGPILLGEFEGVAYFATEIAGDAPPVQTGQSEFQELRAASARLSAPDAGMLAYAKAMIHWHSRHRYCGICGHPTNPAEAGHVRVCTSCAVHHFPRTDSAVIMLVTDGDRALVGRQASWPKGMYSVLAGFVEPGETLEAAVAREVLEEAGIEVTNCRYQASQPWPFPGSLMLGFRADAVTTTISIDRTELDDARWVSRDWLRTNPDSDEFRMPPSGAIARHMIDAWVAEE